MRKLLVVVLVGLNMSMATAKTIAVATDSAVKTLQQAVKLATDGDSVLVMPGVYSSHNTIIDKKLIILGKGYPVLDAQLKEEVITILADGVVLDGFIVRNSKTGDLRDYAGIRVHKARNVSIRNNRLINTFFGIYLSDSDRIEVLNNKIEGKNRSLDSGNGIHSWQCNEIFIKGNSVTGHRDGIYFEFVKKSLIQNNISVRNFRYGLHFMFSDDDQYQNNTFKSNGSGVAVMYSKRITMNRNLFVENWGSSIYGLLLKDITLSNISNNRFIRNTTGIYMEGCENINVKQNNFNNNGWGVRLLANCVNTVFLRNNFNANSFDVTTNGTLNLNRFENNYWDKYEGYDLDKNRIGDIPYRPISLYAQIIEKIPESVMLMRSFIVNLLDKVERALPSLTPESVKDSNPLMTPWKN